MATLEEKAKDKGILGRIVSYLSGESKPKKKKEEKPKMPRLLNKNQRKLLNMIDG